MTFRILETSEVFPGNLSRICANRQSELHLRCTHALPGGLCNQREFFIFSLVPTNFSEYASLDTDE